MPNRMISVTEENFARLKLEENASGLINRLLKDHYNNLKLHKLPLKELENLLKKQEQIDQLNKEMEQIANGNPFA